MTRWVAALVLALGATGAAAGQGAAPAEVRPMLALTKSSWVTLSAAGGEDRLYFTHLESWRCAMAEIRFSVNGGPEQRRETEPCYRDSAQPNALRLRGAAYVAFPAGSVERVAVEVRYADGTRDRVELGRQEILAP